MTIDSPILQERFNHLKTVVLIPTYNNAAKLQAVIDDVRRFTHNVIIVNDGSTDETATILAHCSSLGIIDLKENKGKGNAMQLGFKRAMELQYNYAITIDSDGQHLAKDLEAFLNKIEEFPDSMIVGARNM